MTTHILPALKIARCKNYGNNTSKAFKEMDIKIKRMNIKK
tara:strand:+ start:176 stop:295 length:120 start_codon:yes stop_codon:yes gene_type:complete